MLIFYLYTFILGLVFGSFINVCALRYNSDTKATKGRSKCPNCDHTLAWYDLIPLFSYISTGGKCRYCHNKISSRYPIVELLFAVVYTLVFYVYGLTLTTLIYLVVVSVLLYAALVDLETMFIPDRTHVILILCGIALIIIDPSTLTSSLIGAVIVSIPLFILAYITKGMGYGDVKLMASAGLVIGYANIIFAMALGAIIGAIIGIYKMRVESASGKTEMALGPSLIAAIIIAILCGNQLITWYLTTFF